MPNSYRKTTLVLTLTPRSSQWGRVILISYHAIYISSIHVTTYYLASITPNLFNRPPHPYLQAQLHWDSRTSPISRKGNIKNSMSALAWHIKMEPAFPNITSPKMYKLLAVGNSPIFSFCMGCCSPDGPLTPEIPNFCLLYFNPLAFGL